MPKALRQFTYKGRTNRSYDLQTTGDKNEYLNAIKQQAQSLEALELKSDWPVGLEILHPPLDFRAPNYLKDLTTIARALGANVNQCSPRQIVPASDKLGNPAHLLSSLREQVDLGGVRDCCLALEGRGCHTAASLACVFN
ncbi:hypothetical protein BDV06DRAFT_218648 [Aspergillus oleicola]